MENFEDRRYYLFMISAQGDALEDTKRQMFNLWFSFEDS